MPALVEETGGAIDGSFTFVPVGRILTFEFPGFVRATRGIQLEREFLPPRPFPTPTAPTETGHRRSFFTGEARNREPGMVRRIMGNKLYVGNLSFSSTEDSLREAFEAHGAVQEVRVITDRMTGRSRGFGFVTMASSEDAARAIEKMNGAMLDGRALRVNEAEQKTERGGGGGGGYGGRSGGGRPGGGGGGWRDRDGRR
jgi:RNA recognition motif-containing protein